jgi:probable rRNA maturation factor
MTKLNLIIAISKKKIWHRKSDIIVHAILQTIKHLKSFRSEILDTTLMISMLLSDDIKLHKMNLKYRNKNKPTNVLSFQNIDWQDEITDILSLEQIDINRNTHCYSIDGDICTKQIFHDKSLKVLQVGDIAISYERILEESAEQGKTFDEYLSFIAIHGTLHLMGYDHQAEEDTAVMEELERVIMLQCIKV